MFTLTIATCNAAFDENSAAEVARILRDIAKQLERQARDGELTFGAAYDINGNSVGSYHLDEPADRGDMP